MEAKRQIDETYLTQLLKTALKDKADKIDLSKISVRIRYISNNDLYTLVFGSVDFPFNNGNQYHDVNYCINDTVAEIEISCGVLGNLSFLRYTVPIT